MAGRWHTDRSHISTTPNQWLVAALTARPMTGVDLSAHRVLSRLRIAKGIALDKKDRKALREANKALAKVGHSLNGPMTELEARELDFELENDLVRTALYRHFDKNGNLLYVGVSLNAIERTISHRDKSHWYNDIARIEIEWHHSRSAAYYHQKQAIQREHPRYNVRDNASTAQ
jgi:hypothetical protein